MFPKKSYLISSSHKVLQDLATEWKSVSMRSKFQQHPNRFQQFSLQLNGLLFDYSKQLIDETVVKHLTSLAHDVQLDEAMEAMFNGEKINETENRAVLHTALRNKSKNPVYVDGKNVMVDIQAEWQKMKIFTDLVRKGAWTGYSGLPISDVVNIGIGGSDLGPAMVCEALKPYSLPHLRVHFVSNVDATHLQQCLKGLNPETTLFIIASKTFTTQETMTNAQTARSWLVKALGSDAVSRHFIAVSTAHREVAAFGIPEENRFTFWDWVGGRFSLWSSIGISIMVQIGFDRFMELLDGAHAADVHFKETDFSSNIPVVMALLGLWNHNYLQASTEAILPYDQSLQLFPPYLQQADMESNGKAIDRQGKPVSYTTGPVVWGEPGTNGQHAFYQLIHQGTQLIPCTFIVPAVSHFETGNHHPILLSHCLAQAKALMMGKDLHEAEAELISAGLSEEMRAAQLPYKTFAGNIPSSMFIIPELNPFHLGQLIALFEHKIFVQGVLWNIFSFDQWGVELGKQLASGILPELIGKSAITEHDGSTAALIAWIQQHRATVS